MIRKLIIRWFGYSFLFCSGMLALFLIPDSVLADKDKTWKVEVMNNVKVNRFPDYSLAENDCYPACACSFSGNDKLQCAVPMRTRGAVCEGNPKDHKVLLIEIPQPKDFKPDPPVPGFSANYFNDQALWVNSSGDRFVRWEIKGNGDHGLALIKNNTNAVTVSRTNIALANSAALCSSTGVWYLLVWDASSRIGFKLDVYEMNDKMELSRIAQYNGPGHHEIETLSAIFISQDVMHFIRADVNPRDNWPRLLTFDLNVKDKKWSKEKEIFKHNDFVGSIRPEVLFLNDQYYYFWEIDEGMNKTELSGVHYRYTPTGKTVKVAAGTHGFKTLPVDGKIVFCYSMEEDPKNIYFRVIYKGSVGPPVAIKLDSPRKHSLWGHSFVLGNSSDAKLTFWFVNTFDMNTFHKMKIIEANP